MNSIRANELAAHTASREPEQNLFVRVLLDGGIKLLSVYSVPIDRLTFNIRNGRFASELLAKEKALNRKLDPNDTTDVLVIRQLLLDQNPIETTALRDDLVKNEQIDAGIITADGAVINANRRMAVISKLFDDTHDQKWAFLKVAVLPNTVTEADLWRIEAGLQFAKDFRLDYGPINELLKLREGKACGLNEKDIAATLMGRFTDKEVEARLRVLMLIESYLQAIGRAGDYSYIGTARSMEKFNALSDNVIESLKAKTDIDPLELMRLTIAGFGLIDQGDSNYLAIRQLAPIARNRAALSALLDPLPDDPLKADAELLLDAFNNARDLVEGQKDAEKPDRLLNRALAALNSIDRDNKKLQSASTQALVNEVVKLSTSLLSGANE